MAPDGMKDRFELYRKWFKTLLVKEYLNLPVKEQDKLLAIAETFIKDCKELHKEAQKILEKTIQVKVKSILSPDNKEENYIIIGQVEDSQDVRISYPSEIKKPTVGATLSHVVFSTDGEMWYSSKQELIIGRKI